MRKHQVDYVVQIKHFEEIVWDDEEVFESLAEGREFTKNFLSFEFECETRIIKRTINEEIV